MRVSFVALGLAVLSSQLGGVYAITIPGDSALPAPDLVDRDIAAEMPKRDTKLERPKANDPIAKPVKPVLVLPNDADPKWKAVRPKKGQKKKPINTGPKPKSLLEAIDPGTKEDKADTVKVVVPKKPAHRRRELEKITKRSGPEFALKWPKWKEIFELIDDELRNNRQVTMPIIIYVFGGVSALHLQARGPRGKTADCDFMLFPQTNQAHANALNEAITAVYSANTHRYANNYMNQAVTTWISPANRATIIQHSTTALWRGRKLWVYHADFGAQLANKMDKISESIKDGHQPERKDVQDATAFLQMCVRGNNNSRVTYSNLRQYCQRIGYNQADTRELIINAARAVQDKWPGFAQDIMNMAAEDSE